MNGFQFRVAISAAAAAASTCCSPARNNSSAPRQRSTQCRSLKQQSMWGNIEEGWCYASRRLLSISIPAYCAGKRRPLCKKQSGREQRNYRRGLIGCERSQSRCGALRLVSTCVWAGPVLNDRSAPATVTNAELNLILLTARSREDFWRSHCRTVRSVFLSFIYLEKCILASEMLMFRTKDAPAKLSLNRLALVEGSSLAMF